MSSSNGANGNRSSAELERDVAAQRHRVEARIGEIRERLSPGQLLDEVLSHTKDGGAQFASNLGSQVQANPLPATLLGVSLAWMISSSLAGKAQPAVVETPAPSHDYPYARAAGTGLKRIGHTADEAGQWWSEFQTEAGDRFKARSNEAGERAGHFIDQGGKMFSGFIDDAGNRVQRFQDEAGNSLADASNWASHSWNDARRQVGAGIRGIGRSARHAGEGLMAGSQHLSEGAQQQGDRLVHTATKLFDEQPLIAGALAFAVGAALGAVLPPTEQEDQLVGKEADRLKRDAGRAANELYRQGREEAADLYQDVRDEASELYDDARQRVTETAEQHLPPSQARH